jgi:hypothetical protein
MAGRPLSPNRELALLMGDKTYHGSLHAKCGTNERYVTGGGCVHCARLIATEQRDARKFLKEHAAEQANEKIREQDGVTLDSVPTNGLSAFEQSIEDDLM